ncbi:MAG: DMT family transporter [Nitratireductor sp.]|nr:DMT family transporter [Nitratireductor sp.]
MNATLSGFAAIGMWAMLALFTAASGSVPPFQLLAMTFLVGGGVGLAGWVIKPPRRGSLALPPVVWLVGIGGLFGYHFFYYTALRNAPVAEAGLIAYLWPLLIVLFSSLLPGERLRWYHLIGALAGFAGAALLITGKSSMAGTGNWLGYASAMACALIWSGYSVISRLFKTAPTDAVTVYCLATALLSALCHLAFETTVWPANLLEWLAVLALGLMPVGLAFYLWDHAVKHGPIQLIGSAAYAAPVLSTMVLVATGFAEPGWRLVAAAILVTAGAIVASGRFLPSQTAGVPE